jgi:ketosteroid isomerase-like protein
MPDDQALSAQLTAFANALRANDLAAATPFFAVNADFRSTGGLVRGRDQIAAGAGQQLIARASGRIISSKWLPGEVALVDGVFESGNERGWFTEIWRQVGQNHVIQTSRIRVGPSAAAFDALNQMNPNVVSDTVPPAIRDAEANALRQQFGAFRAAFNGANLEGVLRLCSPTCNAIPVFSFLQGRAQVFTGRAQIGEKAARMLGQDVINPDPNAQRAAFLAGDAKVINFLSRTLAVVDGTAEIGGIPSAHEFAPRELRGVYTNVWRKSAGTWRCEGARAWF